MYRIPRGSNLSKLSLQDKSLFRTSELALLWGIQNKNTLYTTVKRYIKDGVLFRVYKGLYSKKPVGKLNPFEIACAVAGSYSYISNETVLSDNGIIMQQPNYITVVGRKKDLISVGSLSILIRSMSNSYLLNRTGIENKGTYSVATVERALADMLHYSPSYFVDNGKALNKKTFHTILSDVFNRNDHPLP